MIKLILIKTKGIAKKIRKHLRKLNNFLLLIGAKSYSLRNQRLQVILKKENIFNIKKIEKYEEGFNDTYVVLANKNIVVKTNNQRRFEFYENIFLKYEPIYNFKPYKERYVYEKYTFEKLYNLNVHIHGDGIVFPMLKGISLDNFRSNPVFFELLQKSIIKLRALQIGHGDFHIGNILVSKKNEIYLIDFEMTFNNNYLEPEEIFIYDILYLFSQLECLYKSFYEDNYQQIKSIVNNIFTKKEKENFILVLNKSRKYFTHLNEVRCESLFIE